MWFLFHTGDTYNQRDTESLRKYFANEIIENCSKEQVQTKQKLNNETKRNSTPHQYNLLSQDIGTDMYGLIDKKYPFTSFNPFMTEVVIIQKPVH